MRKNYDDFVRVMSSMTEDGHDIDRLVLTAETMETFLTDGDFNEEVEEQHDQLGEFTVPIERGDGDYILSESGEKFEL